MGRIGIGEMAILAILLILLFGAGRVSDLGKGLADGIKNFRRGLRDDDAPPEPPKQISGSTDTKPHSDQTSQTKA
jgi:sec-independent protein translocase protein TatA